VSSQAGVTHPAGYPYDDAGGRLVGGSYVA
jgi:hypothetical protein